VLDGLHLVFVELPKFKAKNLTEKKMQVLWLRFLTEIDRDGADEVSQDLLDNPQTGEALEIVRESGLNDAERAALQKYINNGYKLFVQRCADGRGMSVEAIEKIAEGRVWTGATAKELGLVDELGGLDKAIEIAAQKSGIEAYSIIHHPSQESFFDSLMEPIKEDYIQGQLAETMGEYYEYVKFIQNVQNMDRIQARMPFDLRIR
jgi:protease-4